MLQKDPTRRLGFYNEFEEVKDHPFFENLDWQKILNKEKEGPLKPSLYGFYFDKEYVQDLTQEEVFDFKTEMESYSTEN